MDAHDFMQDYLKDCAPAAYGTKTKVEPEARLNLNEYQYPISPKVIKAIEEQAPLSSQYVYLGDNTTGELIEKIARYAGVGPENVALEAGLDQSFNRLPKVFIGPGENLVTMSPMYPELMHGTKRSGGEVKYVPLDRPEFTLDPDKVLEAVDRKTKIVFICNPNNPTSTKYPRDDILKIVENAKAMVFVDECYYEYCGETVADVIDEYKNLVVPRSFSKAFGLAGARTAYFLGSPEFVDAYTRILSGFEYNRFGVCAAIASLDDLGFYEDIWARIKGERDLLVADLRKMGLKVWDSAAGMIFLDCSATGKSSTEVRDYFMDKHRILIRDVSATFTEMEPKYISFAIGTPEINQKLRAGFKELMA